MHGTESLLDHVYDCRPGGRFRSTAVVGAGSDRPDRCGLLVAGLSQQMVLRSPEQRSLHLPSANPNVLARPNVFVRAQFFSAGTYGSWEVFLTIERFLAFS
jgi:hypothetical protein